MNTIAFDKKNVKMVAHRGVSGLEMENTAAAFVAAGNRSYFGIETDVHVTSDKKFVIIHDDETDYVSEKRMIVEESTLEALRAIPLFDKEKGVFRADLCMPTLEEYIRICKRYEKIAVLELKNRMQPAEIAEIVEQIKAQDYLEGVLFISFEWENLMDLRALVPGQKAQFLTGRNDEELVKQLADAKIDLDVYHERLSKEYVDLLHANGIEINCWTVDDPELAGKYADWGVDYITSNILE